MRAGRFTITLLIAAAAFAGPTGLATAANTFYVDPVSGSPAGDGSAGNPWRTIEEVIAANLIESTSGGAYINFGAPIKGGDTVLLRSGYHGEIDIEHYNNTAMITIAAEEGHTPEVRRIRIAPGRFWTFRGLTISPSLAPVYEQVTAVDFFSRFVGVCRDLVVEDCFIYSVLDTSGWSAADWVNNACHGINLGLDGTRLMARNNRLLNVDFGIMCSATESTAEYNEVTNFSGDGINAMNHGVVVQYNLIRNSFSVDDNHDDGIQGYLAGNGVGQVNDVILRGNVIINRSDPNQPHQGALQGIGCFGGPYNNWLIENNVVLTNHWHGITLYAANDSTVVNNTVFSKWYHGSQSNFETWIEVWGTGTNIVRNNISHRFKVASTVSSNNLVITQGQDVSGWFVDPDNFDMRLIAGSPAVDTGSSLDVPDIDADEFYRPIGSLWDVGAYEFASMPAVGADAGDDQTLIDADENGLEVVMLDGSGSWSLNGTITDYLWTRDGTYVGSGVSVPGILAIGVTTFTLRVTTSTGAQAYDEVTYTVESPGAVTPGDADGDGDVDLDDFVILKQNFGTAAGATQADGDFDGDGDVDLDDFVILKQNFGS